MATVEVTELNAPEGPKLVPFSTNPEELAANTKELLQLAEEFSRAHMVQMDPSHDFLHVERVRRTALRLAKQFPEGEVDLLVVEVAALFHDLNDSKYATANTTSLETILNPFFIDTYPLLPLLKNGKAHLIAEIIDWTSWSKEQKLLKLWEEKGDEEEKDVRAKEFKEWFKTSKELHCVQDADRLDAIGAFGILRCAAFSAAKNRPLYIPKGREGWEGTCVQHFHDKLFKINEDTMKTPLGKEMAAKRQKLMHDLVDGVEEEFNL